MFQVLFKNRSIIFDVLVAASLLLALFFDNRGTHNFLLGFATAIAVMNW
jgi:hypothetical protein